LANVLPISDITYTLGSPSLRWANIFAATGTFGGTITIGTDTIEGSATTTLFTTGNANQLVLGTNGNIGLGTANPQVQLHIMRSDAKVRLAADNNNYGEFGADGLTSYIDVVGMGNRFDIRFDSIPQWTVLENGNVGIGTTTPSQRLTVTGNIGIQAGANAFIGTLDNFALSLRTNNTDRIFITSGGNVGIGTTAPASILELRRSTSSPILTITAATSTTFSPQIAFRTGTTPTTNFTLGVDISTGRLKIVPSSDITTSTGITIDSSGNVGIGTTTPSEKLHVVGNALISGTGTFQTSPLTIGNIVLSHTGLTASRTFTFPNVSDTLVSLTASQTLTNKTLSTGSTWQGNVITTTYGGTGLSSVASGALLYGSGGTSLNTLPIGPSGTILSSSGSAPQWSTPSSLNILTGSGTANTVAKWTATTTLGNSIITDNGTLVTISGQLQTTGTTTLATTGGNVGIGTTTPGEKLEVVGNIFVKGTRPEVKLNYTVTTGNVRLAVYSGSNAYLTSNAYFDGTAWQRDDTASGSGVLSLLNNTLTWRYAPPGANPISLIEAFRIDSSGNVGIGTTAPSEKLDIEGGSADVYLKLHTAGGYSSGIKLYGGSVDIWGIRYSDPDNKLYIEKDGTQYVTVQSGGNVGIGTTTPGAKLHIQDGYLRIDSPGLGWGTNQRIVSSGPLSFQPDTDNSGDPFIYFLNPAGSPTVFINTNSGNVGIGTTGPVSILELRRSTSSPILTITAATSTTYSPQIAFRTGVTPTTNFTLGVDISTGKLKIVPSSDITTSTGITIDSSGNVGIGTTTPSAKLTVNGDLYVSATSTLGSATSTPVIFGGYVQSNIIPYTDLTYSLGSSNFRWKELYVGTSTISNSLSLSYLTSGSVLFAGSGGTISQNNSKLFWDNTNFRLGIGTSSPAGILHVATGTVNALVVDNNGNVGIGTTSPQYKVHAIGNALFVTLVPLGVTIGPLYHPSPATTDECGWSVAIGDVNQDGKADVAMGCFFDDNTATNQGSVVVFTRNAANNGFDSGVVLYHPSPAASDYCGRSVAIGDVNQDGKADVAMGCFFDDNTATDQGSVVVFTRNATNDGFDPGVVLYHPSPAASDFCGISVAIGDVNQDGKADVAMGCSSDDNTATNQGSVVVFTRNAANTGFDSGVVLYHPSPAASDFCGISVAIGDVNQDGKADVAMGCYQDDNTATNQGSVVVFTRNAANTGFDSGVVLYHPSPAASDFCGISVAIGDVNQDGKADVAMGCYQDDNTATDQGSVVVFTRNAANTGFDSGVVLYHPSPAASDFCGISVAIGDVNQDGKADVAMGCYQDDNTATDQGSVVVFTRNATNDGFDPGVVLYHPSPADFDYCGRSAAIGDVNQDGKADLAMGCIFDTNTAAEQGSAVVFESGNKESLIVKDGNVGIGTTTPSYKLTVSGGDIYGSNNLYIAGNVGIGTTAPETTLDVNGFAYIRDYLYVGGISGSKNTIRGFYWNTPLVFENANASGVYFERMRIDTSGNVGIGTTAPASILELYRTNASPILTITAATSTTYSPQIAFRTGSTPTTNFTLGVDISTGKLKIVPSSDISTSTGITIDSSGNVGIGTTTPGAKLHIQDGYLRINSPGLGWGTNQRIVSSGPLSFQPDTDNSGDPFIYFLNPAGSPTVFINTNSGNVGIGTTAPAAKLHVEYSPGNQGTIAIFGNSSRVRIIDEGTNLPSGIAAIGPAYGLGLYAANGPLRFFTGGTSTEYERMRIDTSGNVGIGTTAPSAKLTVNGDLYVSATSTLGSATSTPVIFGGYVQSNFIPYTDLTYSLGSSNFRWKELYVGTSTISNSLSLSYLTSGSVLFAGSGGTISQNNSKLFWDNTNFRLGIGTSSPAGILHVATGTVNALVVDNNGNVGIGTSSPATRLEVGMNSTSNEGITVRSQGNAFIQLLADTDNDPSEIGAPYILFSQDGGSVTGILGTVQNAGQDPSGASHSGTIANALLLSNRSSNALQFGTNAVVRMTISSTGNVGIGTTSPAYLLHVFRSTDGDVAGFTDANGTCTINPTNTSLICTSDIRLKNVVGSLSHSLEKVISLNPIEYYWKNQVDSNLRFGFAAQEVEKVIPELVFTNPDGIKSLNYIGLIPFLVGAIKEQQKEIEELKLVLNEYGILATNNGTASNEQLNSEQGTIFDRFTLAIKKSLEKLGLIIENGIAKVKELIVEKLTAEIIVAKEIKTERITTNEIQIVDKATGEIYCTWIENGEWKKVKGECEAMSNQTTNNETTNNHTTNNETTNSEQSSTNSSSTSVGTSTEEVNQETTTSTNEQLSGEQPIITSSSTITTTTSSTE
jgi:ethanolamine utilization microcompartment shell protein EutS